MCVMLVFLIPVHQHFEITKIVRDIKTTFNLIPSMEKWIKYNIKGVGKFIGYQPRNCKEGGMKICGRHPRRLNVPKCS